MSTSLGASTALYRATQLGGIAAYFADRKRYGPNAIAAWLVKYVNEQRDSLGLAPWSDEKVRIWFLESYRIDSFDQYDQKEFQKAYNTLKGSLWARERLSTPDELKLVRSHFGNIDFTPDLDD